MLVDAGINVDRYDDWHDNPYGLETIGSFTFGDGINRDPKRVKWIYDHLKNKERISIDDLKLVACVGKDCLMSATDMIHWLVYFGLYRGEYTC